MKALFWIVLIAGAAGCVYWWRRWRQREDERERAAEQRFVDLLGEQALAAEVAQRLVPDAVARGGDGLKRDGVVARTVRSDQ